MGKKQVQLIDSLSFYEKAINGQADENSFRYEIMQPMEKMWQYLNAPLLPKTPGGYDVVMASEMMGMWTPRKSVDLIADQISELKATKIFEEYQAVIDTGIARFENIGYEIPLKEFVLNILLADPENKIVMASEGYSGFGGIPGYMILIVFPNDYNRTRLKSALAHEFNHNIRFTYAPFNHGDVSVEEYLVIEGLAEVFAESLFGIEQRGPWVQDYDEEELAYSIEVIKDGRKGRGFEEVAAYMYGDEVAREQGYAPVGLSRNAGYTIGYHIVKEYLKNSGATIEEATLSPSEIIISGSHVFD
ncbi:DUF2268 domain-containing protein [Enterococcus sp. ALS3]|uniref:DUF2268 domain-containing protein n=1 Tax=Enterococcus alishanensis TaxID=1303817 RepID=A0ABS6TGK0_9ENTE|nr:DUF2268 domain-containing protein [Enterococcus alishanensis]MBV7392102.1 DUF2268 domain-containing protein [Enterococcus alishanensis]